MARTGRGASGGPRGRRRSRPQRRRDWPRPCASSVKQVGSWWPARGASRGADPGGEPYEAMERSLLASGPLRLQSLGNRGEGCSPADSAGILGGDQSQVQGRRGLGGGGRRARPLGAGDPGLFSAGVRVQALRLAPAWEKSGQASPRTQGQPAASGAVPPPGWAACALGLSHRRRRSPGTVAVKLGDRQTAWGSAAG